MPELGTLLIFAAVVLAMRVALVLDTAFLLSYGRDRRGAARFGRRLP